MAKKKSMRIHELAKEIGVSSKEICQYLKKSSHFCSVNANEVSRVQKHFQKSPPPSESSQSVRSSTSSSPTPKPKPVITTLSPTRRKKIKVKSVSSRKSKAAQVSTSKPASSSSSSSPSIKTVPPPSKEKRSSSGQKPSPPPPTAKPKPSPPAPPKEIVVEPPVTVRTLSNASGIRANEIIAVLMKNKYMVTMNDPIPEEGLLFIEEAFDREIILKKEKDLEEEVKEILEQEDAPEQLRPKFPVVTFVGHVDHGKTSLLDAIRKTDVHKREAGGITQHIGAYSVTTADGRKITFIDTPGHEAFTEMRARGVKVTDIVVLVVAADDGVMPQTKEAISHAQAADVPIVVAINKCDKPEANPEKIRRQLAELNLLWDGWGGDTLMVEVSALTGEGLEELVETILDVADIYELRANPNRPAVATVIEAKISELRGPLATVIVNKGTLRLGDVVLCGATYGKVRALYDYQGQSIASCLPGEACEVVGLHEVPSAGEVMVVLPDLMKSRQIAEKRKQTKRQATRRIERSHLTLENLFARIGQGQTKEVRLIIKADTQGSVEALREKLLQIQHEEVSVKILHEGVGAINVSDVHLANASDAIIIGFHVAADMEANALATEKKVEIRLYQIIYKVIEDIKAALAGLLEPELREVETARIEVRETFKSGKVGTIAGCYVKQGKVERNNKIRVCRQGKIIYDSKIESLRRFKDDVKEVKENFECGIKIENFNDVKVGDELIAYKIEKIARTLS